MEAFIFDVNVNEVSRRHNPLVLTYEYMLIRASPEIS